MMVDSPVADSPVEDSPVEDSPVEDSPVEDSPVEDSPDLDFHSDLPIHRLVDQTGLVDNRVAPFKGFSCGREQTEAIDRVPLEGRNERQSNRCC